MSDASDGRVGQVISKFCQLSQPFDTFRPRFWGGKIELPEAGAITEKAVS